MLATVLKKSVAPLLSSKGFRRSGFVWNRQSSGLIHVLDIQLLDKVVSKEQLSFTVNLGVFIEQVWRMVWDKPVPRIIQEVDCYPRLRIGKLLGQGPLHMHVGWTLNAATDIEAVGSELHDILLDKAMPFLDGLDSIRAALTVAEDPMLHRFPAERLGYAVLKGLTGQRDEATKILTEMLANPRLKAWHDRVRGVSGRLASLS